MPRANRFFARKSSRSPVKQKNRGNWFRERVNQNGSLAGYSLMLALFTAVIYFLIRPPAADDISGFRVDHPSPRVVTAPFSFTYTDEISTQAKKREAEAKVLPVFNHHPEHLEHTLQAIERLAQAAQSIPQQEGETPKAWAERVLKQAGIELSNHQYALPQEAPEIVPRTTYQSLAFYGHNETFWKTLLSHVRTAVGRIGIADTLVPIRKTSAPGSNYPAPIVLAVALVGPNGTERIATAVHEIRSVSESRQRFEELMAASYPNTPKDTAVRQLAGDILAAVGLKPTLIFNQELTRQRRQNAREEIAPVVVTVNKGETLIGKNAIVTPQHVQKLEAMRERMRISPVAEVGYFLFAAVFVALCMVFIKTYYKEIASDKPKIAVLFVVMMMLLAVTRVIAHLSMLDLGMNTLKPVGYAVPMGALGVIVTILAGTRLAVFCCAITSVYMEMILRGHSADPTMPYLLVALVTSYGAIYTVTRIRQRNDLYRAGGVAMLLAVLLILAAELQNYTNFEAFMARTEVLKWALIWGGVNGALVSILSIALLPIIEDLYGITTDIKLLELCQKNELLQRLEHEAPGTYQHSMRVANLAETAADAINANALLTRVGAYYHDIGKVNKPQFFVENQQTSADKAKRSKLSPNQSCMIIRNHVKHGLELAEKYKLPKIIREFISEHHGTTLIKFFFNQARAHEEIEGTVKEADFRYSGPKPQSKETAILMLADSLEANSRVLENITERGIREMVRKTINDRFMNEQFDECNLTVNDLRVLFHNFSETLTHMLLQQRVAYPPDPGKEGGEKAKPNGDSSGESQAVGADDSLEAVENPPVVIKENEKQEPERIPRRKDKNSHAALQAPRSRNL